MKKSFQILLITFLFVGLTMNVDAQQRLTGSITGMVIDSDGNPLPGCTVTLTGPALQGQIIFVTSEAGTFRFPSVPPGSDFTCTLEMPGFKTIVRPGLKVNVGKATNISVTMELSSLQEEVTVVAFSPTVDVKASKTAVNYSKSFIYNMPIARDLYDVLNSIPGSVSEGVSYRRTSFISGGTVRGNQYSVDGVTINDPVVMYPMTNINIDVYEEVEMGLSGHPAEVGLADAGFVNIVTKSGGNDFHGGGTVEFYNEDMQKSLLSQEDLEAVGLTEPTGWNAWKDFSLHLGGPIIKDKIWFFTNARYFNWERDFSHVVWDDTIAAGERVYTLDKAPHREYNAFAKLTFQLASNVRWMTSYNLANITEDFYTNRIHNYRDVTATVKWDGEMGHTISSQLNWVLSQNAYLDLRFGYIRRWFPIPYSDHALPDEPQNRDIYYNIYRNNPRYQETYKRQRINPSVTVNLFKDDFLGGNHEIKIGVEYERTSSSWDWWRENPYYFYYYDGDIYSYPNDENLNRGRFYTYICGGEEGSSITKNQMQRWGGFIQDSFTIKNRLTLNLGLRFDTSQGGIPEQYHAASADPYGILPIIAGDESPYSEFTLEGMDVLRWTHFSPRIGFSYDVFGDGKTSIKGSWSRYNEYLMIQYFSMANPFNPTSGSWYWVDNNWDGVPDPDDSYTLRYMPTDPFTFELEDEINTDSTAPYTDEFTIGIENELARDFSVSINFIYKHKKNLFEDVNDYGLGKEEAWKGYRPDSPYWERFEFLDPGDDGEFNTDDDITSFCYAELADAPDIHYFFTNVVGSYRKYTAMQFIFNKRMSSNWQLLGSVVWSKVWGNIGGRYNWSTGGSPGFDTPNDWVYSDGRLDFDRPIIIKLQSTVVLPYEFILSGYFNHSSGPLYLFQTLTSLKRTVDIYIPDENKYKYPGDPYANVPTEENGLRRGAPITTFDLRVEKRFRFGDAFSIGAYLDILNLLGRSGYLINSNPGGYLDYSDPDNPTFERYGTYGNIEEAFGTRVFKVSLRFTF
jgi:hypothetical protein